LDHWKPPAGIWTLKAACERERKSCAIAKMSSMSVAE
jgi:hypothetical protein